MKEQVTICIGYSVTIFFIGYSHRSLSKPHTLFRNLQTTEPLIRFETNFLRLTYPLPWGMATKRRLNARTGPLPDLPPTVKNKTMFITFSLTHWVAILSCGWAKASSCRLQVSLSCAVICQIVSLQYLSRSSLHCLAGLPCRLFWSYGLQVVTREVHRSSLRQLIFAQTRTTSFFSHCWLFLTSLWPRCWSFCPCTRCWAYFFPFCACLGQVSAPLCHSWQSTINHLLNKPWSIVICKHSNVIWIKYIMCSINWEMIQKDAYLPQISRVEWN